MDDAVLPHLPEVVAALPPGTHPVVVRSFMTSALKSLRLRGRPVSPVRWLETGGAAGPVVEAAGTLGEQA